MTGGIDLNRVSEKLVYEDEFTTKVHKKKRTRIIVAVVVVVLVVALVVGLVVGLKKDSSGTSAKNQSEQPGKPTSSASTPTSTPAPESTTSFTSSSKCFDSAHAPQCPWSRNPLLLVSLDGFRADYLLRKLTLTIQKLRDCGIHTPYMRAVYPTLTFPNHYTIVTGLYPESHGIVGNSIYDPHINASFTMSGSEKYNLKWWGGEPMWVTAKKQGRRTASFFWVGNEMNISGVLPDIWLPYNRSISFEQRVDTVLGWFDLPEQERPEFITLYFNEPDHTAHGFGPNSDEVNTMLGRMDTIIQRLMDGLHKRNIDNCVNMILLADHGMAETSCERQIWLNKYLRNITDMLVYSGTTGYINTKYRKVKNSVQENNKAVPTDDVIASLKCKNPHLNVFSRSTTPVRHHFTNSDRIGNVVLDIEQSWLVYAKKSKSCLKGNHGYDNIYKSMHAMFLAYGPDFKQNLTTEAFENIELYNLMAEVMGLQPAPNNGTQGALSHFLRNSESPSSTSPSPGKVCTAPQEPGPSECSCNSTIAWNPPGRSGMDVFPFGEPALVLNNDSCFLHGTKYSSVYNKLYKAPILTSYPLTANQAQQKNAKVDGCILHDTRISPEDEPTCRHNITTDSDIDFVRLFDTGFSSTKEGLSESSLSSNSVPMYTGFRDGIWAYAFRLMKEYASKFGTVHVTLGPVYDYNFDGHVDTEFTENTKFVDKNSSVPLPSHFYLILIKCSDKTRTLSECVTREATDILSFILPHQNQTNNCLHTTFENIVAKKEMAPAGAISYFATIVIVAKKEMAPTHKEYLLNNVARIRDIEHLTGLTFLTSFERLDGARSRTFLPLQLWPSPLVTPWTDLPCPLTNATCPAGSTPLLLISLDGFRADYLDRHLTPTIQRLARCGVHTPYMRSVYPTVTFPNHYTIVTGLYPESHGIVSNNMYDEEIDQIFKLSARNAKDPRWWKGEPLWITAKKQGLKTATYFWPGSDVNISGIYPDVWKGYDGNAGYTQRVYDVLDWLTMPEETRPDFITLYFDEPDHAGHGSGPDSEEVDGQLETVDELINILMSNLYEKGLHNCINMIIVADHGMASQSCDRDVVLKSLYPNITEMLMFGGVFGQIFPQFKKDSRYNAHRLNSSFDTTEIVKSLTCENSAMKVFTKDTMPRRHHYMNSNRIGEISIDMKDEWRVYSSGSTWCTGGNHGWDNINKNMHALFLAHGPAFKDNFTAAPFENIELYNFMSDVLNISAAPNNGTRGSLNYILRDNKPLTKKDLSVPINSCQPVDNATLSSCGCASIMDVAASDVFMISEDNVFIFGPPESTNDESLCMLHQKGFSVGYSEKMKSPVVLTTKLHQQAENLTIPANKICILNDTRVVSSDDHCSVVTNGTDVKMYPLLGKGAEIISGAYLSSTVVPLYNGFYNGLWKYMFELLADYKTRFGDISLTVGTAYDYNNDALWEGTINETRYFNDDEAVPIPTHVYAILVKCKNTGDQLPCDGNVDILPFILQNLQEDPNCLKPDVYLKDNVARIKDIEILTGLRFMTAYDVEKSARLRTFLPEDIWETSLARSWEDTQCPHQDLCQSEYKPTLLISLDGFRADYLLRNMTPTISRLSKCGVHAPYMRSVYPTKTFPNHYSIVTGLYPESHGIIDNNMYDMEIGKRFYLGSETSGDPRWWGGEPIWLTAKRQGLKTATYFWPGSDVKIQGSYPDIWRKYDGSVTYSSRVQEVISWMSLPKGERPDFITLYFDEPDLAGHKKGPSNEAGIGAALRRVDDTIGQLMDGLFARKLHHCVNLVIIADHGMDDVSCKKIVRLSQYVDSDYLSENFYIWEGPFGRIANNYRYNSTLRDIGAVDTVEPYDALLSNITCASPHMNVYQKPTLPVRHHYTNNDRIDETLLDMETGWLVTRNWAKTCWGGNHGYDNIYKSMEALFLAYGPAFKWNLKIDPFENIELYNMFTEILNITAAPNNGTIGSLNHILKTPRNTESSKQSLQYANASFAIKDADEYTNFVTSHSCTNNCAPLAPDTVRNIYNNLSTSQQVSGHLPGGLPELDATIFQNRNITLLNQLDYTLAYDSDLLSPLWISKTLNGTAALRLCLSDGLVGCEPSTSTLFFLKTNVARTNCYLPDPRILENDTMTCDTNGDVRAVPLNVFSERKDENPVVLTSAVVKMRTVFYTNIWKPVIEYVHHKISTLGNVNILMGPTFDNDHDSLPDDIQSSNTSLPSHFFIVVTNCANTSKTLDYCDQFNIASYVIPHDGDLQMCKDVDMFMTENEARVRDVELLTGTRLLSSLPFDVAVQLRTRLPMSFG